VVLLLALIKLDSPNATLRSAFSQKKIQKKFPQKNFQKKKFQQKKIPKKKISKKKISIFFLENQKTGLPKLLRMS
jgi:hypothetical protein